MLIRVRSTTVDPQGLMATGYQYYIGTAFTDPTNIDNQLTVYDSKSGNVVSNPIDINADGQFINSNGNKITPFIKEEAYSLTILSPDGGIWDQSPNIESDNLDVDGQNDTVVDQVYDYLSLAQTSSLSDYDYIYIRSELDAPLDPVNGRYLHADGTSGTPSSGDIDKFYDINGKGFARDNEQRIEPSIKNIKRTIITSSESAWVPDSDTAIISFDIVGAGAGGGGAEYTGIGAAAAGGGGSGAFASVMTDVIDESYDITIGLGGSGGAGAVPSKGEEGGDSSVISTSLSVTVSGGTGGAPASSASNVAVNGGAGGIIFGSIGDYNCSGNPGGVGSVISSSIANLGTGAPSIYGGSLGWSLDGGADALGPGAGAGGGVTSITSDDGGDGADGQVIIMEYISSL